MEAALNQVLSAVIAILGPTVMILLLERRRLRKSLARKQRFLHDCVQAACPPVGWCFGPTFLAIQRDKLFRAEWDAIQLERRLGDLQEQCDRQTARSEAILGQAKRWAREAKGSRDRRLR